MVRGQLSVMYPDSCLLDYNDEIVGIIRAPNVRDYTAYEALENTLSGSGLIVGTSIENRGIEPLADLLQQARFACQYAKRMQFSRVVTRFFNCAVEALLFSDWSLESKKAACHPGVSRLWKEAQKKNSVLFETLTAYINQERSVSATAKDLCFSYCSARQTAVRAARAALLSTSRMLDSRLSPPVSSFTLASR